MAQQPSCALCSAFSALTRECRREAPKPIAVNANGQIQIIGAWPGTVDTNWCAAFIAIKPEGETQQ